MLLHLDTDLGGDPDDTAALVLALGLGDVELAAVTTTIDVDGSRAGCVHEVLRLAGRTDVPVAAGAPLSTTTGEPARAELGPDWWPRGVTPRPAPPGAATDALAASVARGATVAAIGPLTNLALLEQAHPGALRGARLVVMGGWVAPPQPGLPQWGPERDFNVQWDTAAAEVVARAGADVTLVTLPATLQAPLRAADLARLRAAGPLGALVARQSEAHAQPSGKAALGPAHAGLPDDLLNFHYDPVTVAVACGWAGVTRERPRLLAATGADGVLRWQQDPAGPSYDVVTAVDGAAFGDHWLAAVEAADAAARANRRGSGA